VACFNQVDFRRNHGPVDESETQSQQHHIVGVPRAASNAS
jgi:hypothetical protein